MCKDNVKISFISCLIPKWEIPAFVFLNILVFQNPFRKWSMVLMHDIILSKWFSGWKQYESNHTKSGQMAISYQLRLPEGICCFIDLQHSVNDRLSLLPSHYWKRLIAIFDVNDIYKCTSGCAGSVCFSANSIQEVNILFTSKSSWFCSDIISCDSLIQFQNIYRCWIKICWHFYLFLALSISHFIIPVYDICF